MKKANRFISLLCGLALMLSTFAACGGTTASAPSAKGYASPQSTAAKPVTLRFSWWGSDARNEATLKVIEQYKEIAPHVTIEGEYMGADGYPEKMKAQLTSGTAPDIIQSDAQWTDDLRRMGDYFLDLNAYSKVLDMSGFDKNFLDGFCTMDGKIQYLPTGINNLTFVFNTAVMERVGISVDQEWTWETLLSEGAKVNAAAQDEYFLCLNQTALMEVLRSYLRQMIGEQFIKEDYTLGFNREQAVKIFEYEKQMFDQKILQPADVSFSFNLQTVMMDPEWVNKKFAGTIDLTSVIGGIVEPFADTVDVALLPVLAGAKNSALSIKPAQIIGINNKTAAPEECAKFFDYFFNNEQAIQTLRDTRSIQPTVNGRKICNDAGLVNPSVAKAVDLASSCFVPNIAENGPSRNAQVIVAFVNAVEGVGYGTATPEQAADQMIGELGVIMDQLRETA